MLFTLTRRALPAVLTPALALGLAACSDTADDIALDDHDDATIAAPHGGAVAALGDDVAHVELALDPATGTVTLYLLDSAGVGEVMTSQESIHVEMEIGDEHAEGADEHAEAEEDHAEAEEDHAEGEDEHADDDADGHKIALELMPMGSGDGFSAYAATHPDLVGVEAFHCQIDHVEIDGAEFHDISVEFPGVGHPEHHDEEDHHG